jgi:hypothetical protein
MTTDPQGREPVNGQTSETEYDLDRWERYNNILAEVFGETERQNDLWGQQDHPLISSEDPTGLYLLGRTYRSMEVLTKQRFAKGERSWALIELEEIFEAVSERDPGKARVEWLQVAAVAVSVVAALDRAAGLTPAGPPMELTIDGRTVDDVPLPQDTPTRDLSVGRRVAPFAMGPVTPEEIDANYRRRLEDPDGKALVEKIAAKKAEILSTGFFDEGGPVPPLWPVDDDRSSERAVREAECIINDPAATTDQVAEADAVLRRAEEEGIVPDRPVSPHPYNGAGRLHGICRCGEGPDDKVHRCPQPGCSPVICPGGSDCFGGHPAAGGEES